MKAKLKDLGKISTGNTPSKNISEFYNSEDIGFVKPDIISELQIDYIENTAEYLAEAARSKARIVKKNTVFVTCIGNIGKIGIVKDKELAFNQQINAIEPNEKVLPKYLAYGIFANKRRLQAISNAPVVPIINKTQFGEFEIDIIDDTKEQLKIVELLDKVSEVIANRKKELEKLDDLIKARFVELFGKENYPRVALIDLIAEGAGLSYGIVQPGNDGTGDMGVLRPVDMVDGNVSIASIKYIDRTIGEGYRKTELDGDELLITVRGTTGITALTDYRFKGMNVTRGIAVIRYDRSKVNPVYLNTYLNTDESQRYIQEHTRGATLKQINLSDLRIQPIMVPPLSLQKQMADFVEQTDKSKFAVQKALDNAQLLFDSLMQKYFG